MDMNEETIFFEFDNMVSATLAQNSLEELGYKTGLHSELSCPALHIQVDHSELTSALEIAQAHSGRLVGHGQGLTEADTYAKTYNNDGFIPIPAHVVNEDWTEDYATEVNAGNLVAGTTEESNTGNGAEVLDPSGDDTVFDAGVRL
jgi:hypothetical protein